MFIFSESVCKVPFGKWCANSTNAYNCDVSNYCQQRKFKRPRFPGHRRRCPYPSKSWCSSQKIAQECNVYDL